MPSRPKDIPLEEIASTKAEKNIVWMVHTLTDPIIIEDVTEPVTITAREHHDTPEVTATDFPRRGGTLSSANFVAFAKTEAEAWEKYEDACVRIRPGDTIRLYRHDESVALYTEVRKHLGSEKVLGEELGCTLVDEYNYRGFARFSPEDRVQALMENIREVDGPEDLELDADWDAAPAGTDPAPIEDVNTPIE